LDVSVADSAPSPYVVREDDLAVLKQHYDDAAAGRRPVVLLEGRLGSGKRAAVGELARRAVAESDDVLVWRIAHTDEEDGWNTLLRWYGALFAGLHRSPTFRGKVEMALNSQIPNQPARVQAWFKDFIDAMKTGAPKPGEQQFQVRIPRQSPLLAIVEIACGIARKFPVILEVQSTPLCQSLSIYAMLEALVHESKGTKMLIVLGTEPIDEAAKAWFPMPFLDLVERAKDEIVRVSPQKWESAQVNKYLESKAKAGTTAMAGRIAEISGGLPGFVAEIVDWLDENGKTSEVDSLTLETLANVTPDAEELDLPSDPPKPDATQDTKQAPRKHAGPDDAERVAQLAALLGISFPSNLVADMGGYDRDSIDDLMDATGQLYKELQFSQPLGTWIYQFNKGILRESVLSRHRADEDRDLARRVGAFMERFLVPRGYAFLVKTMRMYAENDARDRAAMLRSVALGADQSIVWAMAQDLVAYFDEVQWPDALRRTIYMNLLDRMVQSGDVAQTEGLYNEAMAWSSTKEDRAMTAWLLFAGSRLDYRRQDLYRARDRANDALKMYQGIDDKVKVAEVHNHLAMVELSDGNATVAIDHAKEAEVAADVPAVRAHSEYVRGLVAKRDQKLQEAADHFQKANEVAGNAGQGPLALESGLHFGETLLMSGQHTKAADVLGRVIQIAKALQNPVRERAATALLGQCQAALRNFEAALQNSTRTLELTRQLKFERFEPIDLYNCGFFNLMLGRATEGVALLRQAKEKAGGSDATFRKELLYNLGAGLVQIGEKAQGEENLMEAIPLAQAAKDWRKVMGACETLATLSIERGNKEAAKQQLEQALAAADAGGLKEERKGLRRKLDELG
jgi:tetratricopeptide (TPR) repeat protein